MTVRIHPTAAVSPEAIIGTGSSIWNWVQIREGAHLGENCVVSKGVYIDAGVQIGNNVKIQNHVSVYAGVTIEDGVFVGPHVCFTNDLRPRAINPDGTPKQGTDWMITPTVIGYGAAIGANSTIRCGISIGRWAMIGAGSVVVRDVPPHALALGNPARVIGYVCACGQELTEERTCARCGQSIQAVADLITMNRSR